MSRTAVAVILWSAMAVIGGQRVEPMYNLVETRDSVLNETTKPFCILDYIYDSNHTKDQKRDHFYRLETIYYTYGTSFCPSADQTVVKDLKNSFVLINYSNDCNISSQLDYFRLKSIYGLFISIDCSVDIDGSITVTKDTLIDHPFSVSLITQTSAESIVNSKSNQLKLFDINFEQRFDVGFDYSMACIWLLATFTVCLGAFWSGRVRLMIFDLNKQNTTQAIKTNADTKDSKASKGAEEEAFINMSPFLVLGFVLLMALMLLLLYYFFQYLVYVIICLFTLASIASLFACLEPIVLCLCPEWLTRPSFVLFSVRFGKMFFYQLVLLVIALSLSITWFVLRKHPNAWILQDFLGVCFSLNMLRTIRLPSYKICVILLSALFFYDIFFVFITPLVTSKGNSVMVDVATGGSGKSRCGQPGEQIPMVMRIPHSIFKSKNSTDPIDVCSVSRDSLLGFGDILVPGLLVSYCYAFDLICGIKYRIYYITTCVSYGLGLIATFAGLYLMSGSAQPALLYLVPFTTIPPILIALYRKELKQLWVGPESYLLSPSADTTEADNSIEDDNLLIGGSQQSVPQSNG